MTTACTYFKGETSSYQQVWETSCNHRVICEVPIEVGFSFAPLPNAHGKEFCTYCGGRVVLAEKPIEKNTYDGWKAKGYHVMRGEKSTSRDANNVALFTIKQVAKSVPRFNNHFDDVFDDDLEDRYDRDD